MSLHKAIGFARRIQLTAPAILMAAAAAAMAQGSGAGKTPGVGAMAPGFALNTLDKKSVQLKKLEEEGPVVVIVLRGWPGYQCPICTAQVGDLLKNAEAFDKSGAKVVLVYPGPADKLEAHAAEFVTGKGLPKSFSLVVDPDFAMVNAYGLRWEAQGETAYPSTFVIAKDGRVKFANVSHTHGDRAETADILAELAKMK